MAAGVTASAAMGAAARSGPACPVAAIATIAAIAAPREARTAHDEESPVGLFPFVIYPSSRHRLSGFQGAGLHSGDRHPGRVVPIHVSATLQQEDGTWNTRFQNARLQNAGLPVKHWLKYVLKD